MSEQPENYPREQGSAVSATCPTCGETSTDVETREDGSVTLAGHDHGEEAVLDDRHDGAGNNVAAEALATQGEQASGYEREQGTDVSVTDEDA